LNIGKPDFQIFDITWLAYHVKSYIHETLSMNIRFYMVCKP